MKKITKLNVLVLCLTAMDVSRAFATFVVKDNFAYLAAGQSGLLIIDASDPAKPVRVGSFDTSGNAVGVDVAGDFAYVSDQHGGVQILDVKNRASPLPVGIYQTHALGVDVVGNLAYIGSGVPGFEVLDVSNPSNPVRVGSFATRGRVQRLQITGAVAYLAEEKIGLEILDVSDPAKPARVGTYDMGEFSDDIHFHVVGNFAYVVDHGTGSLQIIDVSNPVRPVRVGSSRFINFRFGGVQVAANLAYVAAGSQGLQIWDVTQPSSPVRVGVYANPGVGGIQVVGSWAYVLADGLQVLDLTKLVQPALRINANGGLQIRGLVGVTYVLEESASLGGNLSWTTVSSITLANNPQPVNATLTSGATRFYRARLAP